MGLADFSTQTRNGTVFCDAGSGISILIEEREVIRLPRRWYFYRDHIVGYFNERAAGNAKNNKVYFVIDELDKSIVKFNTEEEWNEYLLDNKLKPRFYTRWYRDNWEYLGIFIALFPVTIMVLILQVFFIVRAMRNKSKSSILKSIILPIVLFVVYILGAFPGSI